MTTAITILLADDHPVFRRGLGLMLASDKQLQVVAEAANGTEALVRLRELQPDIAILDVNMPGQTGFDVARELQSSAPATRLIFLTMHRDEAIFNSALDLGAHGYLLKESAIEDIIACVKNVAAGERFISPQLSTFLFNRANRAAVLTQQKATIQDLTAGERRILKLIAEQRTSREIAELLFISIRTVERHRENICAKL
ncbi:MAG TPA: response regulator transcription factor, partial [Blastocatellia bacterium]|nr:response regulator transcription factor [Blastocatellia bacterium]